MMRTYGMIANISFKMRSFKVQALATEFIIWNGWRNKIVYANNMTELKAEINKFIDEGKHEED